MTCTSFDGGTYVYSTIDHLCHQVVVTATRTTVVHGDLLIAFLGGAAFGAVVVLVLFAWLWWRP